ncbi:MAG: CDP-diacylglycerol--glycerol-3-phosphate 3-phosphatidyltransferase [Oscillospiraceae bacterium]|nr:CDP-diacylglycerol--glycerol-3-phosphate 3-phosphatidyltransferase [Oscillospiraceae bacterium]
MNKLPMNLPNRITIARMLLIPLVLLLLALESIGFRIAAAAVFALASLTDWVDGAIARKRGLVTDFGKFMDPIADKLLVLLPFIWFCRDAAMGGVWAVMLMVAREIAVGGFRMVAAGKGAVIAAGQSGKIKTVVQIIAVLALMLGLSSLGWLIAWVAAALSAVSGVEIFLKNRRVLEEKA